MFKKTRKYTARCTICLQKQSLNSLMKHYKKCHSKVRIARQLVKNSIIQTIPKIFSRKKWTKTKTTKSKKLKIKGNSTKTIYLKDSIQLLCGKNKIIIGDGTKTFDLELTFNDSAGEWKETEKTEEADTSKGYHSYSSSASSEDGNTSLKVPKKRIKRKKVNMKKLGYYCINITQLEKQKTLDERTGEFCARSKNSQKSDLKIVTSDTDTCSDTGTPTSTKHFCRNCGSGYKTETDLVEHMHIHTTFCHLCKVTFVSEFAFKDHMRAHIFKIYMCHVCHQEFIHPEMLHKHFETHVEDRILDGVLDMENDYEHINLNLVCDDYDTSINNIINFLTDGYNYNQCNEHWHNIHCAFHSSFHY
ncbi:unnamed protein product [Callosobruchus maculatus]|uniref:C2H2-type domain-containing protein n=1 Tax=Callosobruchus maculatus TaxID=64391 RepID=A0A653CNT1_CALMS|nr:unnamed protein product [Callosobruchus maculatus]